MDRASFQSEIDRLREQFAALDAETVAAAGAPLTASVATWRWSEAGSGAHRPEPWWRVRGAVGDPGEGWLADRVGGADADRVGFDLEGRVVLVEAHRDGAAAVVEVWSHGPDGSRMLRAAGPEDRGVVWLDRWYEPTRVASVGFGSSSIEDERQVETRFEEWSWEAGWAIRGAVAEQQYISSDDWSETQFALESDDIQSVLWADGGWSVMWVSKPALRDERVIVEALVSGIERAIIAGVAGSGVDRPFVVEHRQGDSGWDVRAPLLPGFVRLGGEAFRDAIRRTNVQDGAALERLSRADEGDREGKSRFTLQSLLDEDAALAAREVNAARRSNDAELRMFVVRVLGAVTERLILRLNEPGAFGETAHPFLAKIRLGLSDPSDEEADAVAREVLGDQRVDEFEASLASTRPKPKGRRVSVEAARADREKLANWLEQQGIDDAQSVAAAAEPAFRLVKPPAGEQPGTRLHGTGLLPPGVAWPKTEADRDLAFLAAVDLSELGEPLASDSSRPAASTLPDAGWLLFFADIECNYEMTDDLIQVVEDPDAPDDESTFYGEQTPNVEGSDARLFFLPPGIEPVDAKPPLARSGKRGWPEDRRAARAELTLPTHYEANEQLGIDEAIEVWEIFEPLQGEAEDDWILGAATGVQGHPIEDGSVLLLHLASVEFQDGGAIQFRIPPEALAAGDWSQAYAVADSG